MEVVGREWQMVKAELVIGIERLDKKLKVSANLGILKWGCKSYSVADSPGAEAEISPAVYRVSKKKRIVSHIKMPTTKKTKTKKQYPFKKDLTWTLFSNVFVTKCLMKTTSFEFGLTFSESTALP